MSSSSPTGGMRFSTRNSFRLRVSNFRVLPAFLYLDERHVDWMSDRVLQMVIAELHGKMQGLLTQRFDKKHSVHVERGEGYQYCYFLRKTSRTEVILLKKKETSFRRVSPVRESEPELLPPSRKRKAPPRSSRSRTRSASVAEPVENDDDDDEFEIKPDPEAPPTEAGSPEEEEDRKDIKPDISITYQGFGTSSLQLVLIIEPYPPLPPSQHAPPSSRLSTRATSMAASRSRSRTQGGTGARYSSTSLSVALGGESSSARAPLPQVHSMRNATRSVSVAGTPGPNSRRGGSSRDWSVTPGPGANVRRSETPLFLRQGTPFFDDDEDDADAHEAYEQALQEGRLRLPSVAPRDALEEDENPDDLPDGMMTMTQRLVQASEIEEGVIRTAAGWEERGEGEESAVLGREEPGD